MGALSGVWAVARMATRMQPHSYRGTHADMACAWVRCLACGLLRAWTCSPIRTEAHMQTWPVHGCISGRVCCCAHGCTCAAPLVQRHTYSYRHGKLRIYRLRGGLGSAERMPIHASMHSCAYMYECACAEASGAPSACPYMHPCTHVHTCMDAPARRRRARRAPRARRSAAARPPAWSPAAAPRRCRAPAGGFGWSYGQGKGR